MRGVFKIQFRGDLLFLAEFPWMYTAVIYDEQLHELQILDTDACLRVWIQIYISQFNVIDSRLLQLIQTVFPSGF